MGVAVAPRRRHHRLPGVGPTPNYGWGAIVTDVNHDGHTDVRSINNDTGVVRTFLGNGAGVFTLAK